MPGAMPVLSVRQLKQIASDSGRDVQSETPTYPTTVIPLQGERKRRTPQRLPAQTRWPSSRRPLVERMFGIRHQPRRNFVSIETPDAPMWVIADQFLVQICTHVACPNCFRMVDVGVVVHPFPQGIVVSVVMHKD